jgi:hypothetical protein
VRMFLVSGKYEIHAYQKTTFVQNPQTMGISYAHRQSLRLRTSP